MKMKQITEEQGLALIKEFQNKCRIKSVTPILLAKAEFFWMGFSQILEIDKFFNDLFRIISKYHRQILVLSFLYHVLE